jgi:hypothetical protein
VDIDLSMGKDELDDKKRGDLQDMLTVTSQTADPNDPEAMKRKRELEDELLSKTLPELARKSEPAQPQPQPLPPNGLDPR